MNAPLGFTAKPIVVTSKRVEKDDSGGGLQFVLSGRVYDEYLRDRLYSVSPGLEQSTDALLKAGYSEAEISQLYKDVRSGPVDLPKPVKLKTTIFVRSLREMVASIRTALLDEETPTLVKHCVQKVASKYGGDTERAFAICVAQMQKSGYLEPGSMKLTAAGKRKSAAHASEPEAGKKLKSYEKLLAKARKEGRTETGVAECLTCEAVEDLELEHDEVENTVAELRRLSGINKYPDRTLKSERSKAFDQRQREAAGLAGAHEDWSLEAADFEDRLDLWHPDKNVKNPGLPMEKPKAASMTKREPVDKSALLLKALKCPPGKEPKMVYGRPACVQKE